MALLLFLLLVQDASRPPWETRTLAEVPAELEYLVARFTPDRVVYEAKKGENFLYVVGNAAGQEFDCVEDLVVAPAGPLFAYRGIRGGKRFLVTSSGVSEPMEESGRPRISPDGKRLAVVLHEGDQEFMSVDGRRGPPYHRVREPLFSPDGTTLVYTASRTGPRGRPEEVIVREEEITATSYSVIWGPTFHPDGKTLVYTAKRGELHFLNVGGKETPSAFGSIMDPVFSRDGKHLAYGAFQDGLHFLVLDDQPVAGTAAANVYVYQGFGFSPDGRFYYEHRQYNYPNVMLAGKDLRPAGESVGTPVFSADGSRIAWIGSLDGKGQVYVDGKVVMQGEGFNRLVLSPDGKTAAFVEWAGGRQVEVEEKVVRGSRVRSVWRDGRSWLHVGAKKSEAFDEVWKPVFSADSKWVGFGARKGSVLSWQVMKVD